ncbi:probable membrane-associated kinase regulator 4 [Zingiber officinale]|uniref:Membrane-associated kinase regulator 4 n=1 Tax=Zingiber officinale TaxID=94328 RepID=A0A8J5KVH6_ZINOF|nr:probable membrane-associated kinase regulator 4 [Zingiber officinale]KAG6494682.1 hypothetical protein ZIOFF_042443 [Zingiber officinale]
MNASQFERVRGASSQLLLWLFFKFSGIQALLASMAIEDTEEDYIDMEFNSSSPIEFEFQMSSNLDDTEQSEASPADELFHRGKLLPLSLIPSLLEDLVQGQIEEKKATRTPKTSATTTPYMSCNASPAAACFIGKEIGLEDLFHDCSEEIIRPHSKKSWSQKLKAVREAATLGSKLKASKAYLKSLFHKPWLSKVKECSKSKGKLMEEQKHGHRRSFSSSSNWLSSTKSSSSSSRNWSKSSSFSSVNSTELSGQSALKRSSSVNSDVERSIQGAIAYCKKSQQKDSSRKSATDVGFCLLNVTKVSPDCDHDKL